MRRPGSFYDAAKGWIPVDNTGNGFGFARSLLQMYRTEQGRNAPDTNWPTGYTYVEVSTPEVRVRASRAELTPAPAAGSAITTPTDFKPRRELRPRLRELKP